MGAPPPSTFFFLATLSFIFCLFPCVVYGGPAYELYPVAYCATTKSLTKTFNNLLSETLNHPNSWQATHLAKITVPGEGDIYRLAMDEGGGKWSLDLSPDIIKVGGESIALRMPNKQEREDVQDIAYGFMTGDGRADNYKNNKIYKTYFKTDPLDPQVALAAAKGSGNNLEHLPGVKPSPKRIKHGWGHVVIGLVPKARNNLGSGTRKATVWEPDEENGGFKSTPGVNIELQGGFAVRGRADLPSFDDQRIVKKKPVPPQPLVVEPKEEEVVQVSSSSGGGSKKKKKGGNKGGGSKVEVVGGSEVPPQTPITTTSSTHTVQQPIVVHNNPVVVPQQAWYWRALGGLARMMRRPYLLPLPFM